MNITVFKYPSGLSVDITVSGLDVDGESGLLDRDEARAVRDQMEEAISELSEFIEGETA